MKIIKSFILIISTLLVCDVAYPSQPNSVGVYIGGGLGYGQTALSRPAQVTTFVRDGFAWTVFTGYQFISHFAAEVGYMDMKDVKAAGVIKGLAVSDTVQPFFIYLAIKGSLPIHNHINLFTKLGGAYAYGKETLQITSTTITRSQHKIVAYGAIGISYIVNSNLSFDVALSTTLKRGTVPRITAGTFDLICKFYRVPKGVES